MLLCLVLGFSLPNHELLSSLQADEKPFGDGVHSVHSLASGCDASCTLGLISCDHSCDSGCAECSTTPQKCGTATSCSIDGTPEKGCTADCEPRSPPPPSPSSPPTSPPPSSPPIDPESTDPTPLRIVWALLIIFLVILPVCALTIFVLARCMGCCNLMDLICIPCEVMKSLCPCVGG